MTGTGGAPRVMRLLSFPSSGVFWAAEGADQASAGEQTISSVVKTYSSATADKYRFCVVQSHDNAILAAVGAGSAPTAPALGKAWWVPALGALIFELTPGSAPYVSLLRAGASDAKASVAFIP